MATVDELLNRSDRKKYSFHEARKEGIRQRKYLLDGRYQTWIRATNTDDSQSAEEEDMD